MGVVMDKGNIALIKKINKEQLIEARARQRHEYFMRYNWIEQDPFCCGLHTHIVCNALDVAFDRYRQGISTFLKVLICFRHGKSEIVSRHLPAHFLGQFPEREVILTSYNSTKAEEFSMETRAVLMSDNFKKLYPDVRIDPNNSGKKQWGLQGRRGKFKCAGISAGIAGAGGSLIIIDDYHGKRRDAENEGERQKVWTTFTDDLMTRRAPACIVILCVTPWHVDDLVARVDKSMKKIPKYPRFSTLKFPAFSKHYTNNARSIIKAYPDLVKPKFAREYKNDSGTLFPERYSKEWYETQQATMSQYSSQGMMQCNPAPRAANFLRVDKFKYYKPDELPPELIEKRAWDLASSEKEVMSDDPDYTVGAKGGIIWVNTAEENVRIPKLYVTDLIRGRWKATKRGKIITGAAIADGIEQGIEAFGAGGKDAYTVLSDILEGISTVTKLNLPGDKLSKATVLEHICEAGNIYFPEGATWVQDLIDEFKLFPLAKHDDIVDAVAMLYELCRFNTLQFCTNEMVSQEHQYELAKIEDQERREDL